MSTHIPRKETFKGHPDLPKTEAEILQKGGPRPGRFRCALVYLSLSVLEFVQQSCLDVLVYLTASFHLLYAEFTKKATMICLNFLHIFKWPSIRFLRG